ncbi:hypothetical protein VNO77_43443 [Canavalia gladiata]|uniref:Uncharacterized protein n=1 Tax=Canavalia gladiata TaxID=3824 RepID=A0AAN9PPX9_CANGL
MLSFSTFNRRLWKILPPEDSRLLDKIRKRIAGRKKLLETVLIDLLSLWKLKKDLQKLSGGVLFPPQTARYANDFVHSYIEPAMVILREHGYSGLVLCFLCKLPGASPRVKSSPNGNTYQDP